MANRRGLAAVVVVAGAGSASEVAAAASKAVETKAEVEAAKAATATVVPRWLRTDLFRLQNTTDRGRILLSQRDYRACDLILVDESLGGCGSDEQIAHATMNDIRIRDLAPAHTQPASQPWSTARAMQVIRTNGFGCVCDEASPPRHTTLLLHSSLLSHSCNPNAILNGNSLWAIQPIKRGRHLPSGPSPTSP
jgi:hypothetical protein